MAKQLPRVAPADKRAVQEIIGRALTDQKFRQALMKSPERALVGYKLSAQTLAFFKEAVHIMAEYDKLQDLIDKILGGQVRGG